LLRTFEDGNKEHRMREPGSRMRFLFYGGYGVGMVPDTCAENALSAPVESTAVTT